MDTMLQPRHMIQLQSFWNLIQATDEGVQKELYVLLQRKYGSKHQTQSTAAPSFLRMQGILKGAGSIETDRQVREDYLQEKYGL